MMAFKQTTWFTGSASLHCLLSTALWIQSLFMVSLVALLGALNFSAFHFLYRGQFFFSNPFQDDTYLEG